MDADESSTDANEPTMYDNMKHNISVEYSEERETTDVYVKRHGSYHEELPGKYFERMKDAYRVCSVPKFFRVTMRAYKKLVVKTALFIFDYQTSNTNW